LETTTKEGQDFWGARNAAEKIDWGVLLNDRRTKEMELKEEWPGSGWIPKQEREK